MPEQINIDEVSPSAKETTKNAAKKPGLTTQKLFTYLAPFWGAIAIAIICLLFVSASNLIFPWVIQNLLDSVFVQHNQAKLNQIGMLLAIVFALRVLFEFGQNYAAFFIGERVVANLRIQLYSHIQKLPLEFFSTRRTGEIMSRITNDVTIIQNSLTNNFLQLIQQFIILIGSVIFVFVINWKLTLVTFILAPVIMLFAAIGGKKVKQFSKEVQEEIEKVSTILEETLSSMRVVKVFARETYEIERFRTSVEAAFRISMKKNWIKATFEPLMSVIAFTAVSFIIWFGGREVLAGHLSPGQLISFLIYLMLLVQPISALSSLYGQGQEALACAERVFELLETPIDKPDDQQAIVLPSLQGQIEFEHVDFRYNDGYMVLKDFSMRVEAGKTVALVGPSGSGKTTLTGLIPRLFAPASGHILIDGYNLQTLAIQPLREQIAIVPQEPTLFGYTIRENIAYGRLDATGEEIEQAARAANAAGFIEKLPHRYETIVGERGVKLSAGQRQRIAIARAILRNPRILILDEATASLDNESEAIVQEAINRLMHGQTTFVIAHRLTTIENADLILVLQEGSIVEQGTHTELLNQDGLYKRLYLRQFKDVVETSEAAAGESALQ